MKTIDQHGTFEEALAGHSAAVAAIARKLRALIEDIYADTVEVPWANQGVIGYGVGPRKMSEHFCYIGLYKGHVNLGFFHGSALPDPAGMLEGTGKKLRHIRIRDDAAIEKEAIRELIVQSLQERRRSLGIS